MSRKSSIVKTGRYRVVREYPIINIPFLQNWRWYSIEEEEVWFGSDSKHWLYVSNTIAYTRWGVFRKLRKLKQPPKPKPEKIVVYEEPEPEEAVDA